MTGGHRKPAGSRRPDTLIVTAGRDPAANHGFVNPPVYHASTVLYESTDAYLEHRARYEYGRRGTPTTDAVTEALARLEGGHGTRLYPSGLAAITSLLLTFLNAGDHLLMTDGVYLPVRRFCDTFLARLGIETTYYDPRIGAGVEELIRPATRLVYTEAPSSLTMEMQDIPAIAAVARGRGIPVAMDNTWGTPLYCRPFDLGVDLSVHAATKYICGHSDAMLGAVTANEAHWPRLLDGFNTLGQAAGPDDVYLAHRGLRTMAVRMERQMRSALDIAAWLRERPEVREVLYPPLPGDRGHELWKRDFTGGASLMSVLLKRPERAAVTALIDALELFGIGASWGGYESLVVPFDPNRHRAQRRWDYDGFAVRFHIGLEDPDDLKADLERGLAALAAA